MSQVLFEEVAYPVVPQLIHDFNGTSQGSSHYFDADQDGYLDIIICGLRYLGPTVTELYFNDGNGNYSLTSNQFAGVYASSIKSADVDGDSDVDLLILGRATNEITKLYLNDGAGNFTEDITQNFIGLRDGDILFLDIENDNDQDLILSGIDNSFNIITVLYENDGNGNFTQALIQPFDPVMLSQLAAADFDNDNDMDVIISGLSISSQRLTKLYVNNGSGNFSEDISNSIMGYQNVSLAVADIDGTNSSDIIITGVDELGDTLTRRYINDGVGNFTEMSCSINGVVFGDLEIGNIDNDGFPDIVVSGVSTNGNSTSLLYFNNGDGSFSYGPPYSLSQLSNSQVKLLDVDLDGDLDLFLNGKKNFDNYTAELHVNSGKGKFYEATTNSFYGIRWADLASGDIDGDGNLDFLMTGQDKQSRMYMAFYHNNNLWDFSLVMDTVFDNLWPTDTELADLDGDSDLDLIVVGKDFDFNYVAKLFTNDGTGVFSEDTNSTFNGVVGNILVGDLNSNLQNDILICGSTVSTSTFTDLYINNNGLFTNAFSPLPDLSASISSADIDGDNDLDIAISGGDGFGNYYQTIYKNDGTANFTSFITSLPVGKIIFADIDNDLDSDIILIESFGPKLIRTYTNDGLGNFTETFTTNFTYYNNKDVTTSDVDLDGDIDLLIVGEDVNNLPLTELYLNIGNGTFILQSNLPFDNVLDSKVHFFDFDNDSDEDVILCGDNGAEYVTILYKNLKIVGIEENSIDSPRVLLYPNPSSGVFHIQSNQEIDYTLVYSLDGTKVYNEPYKPLLNLENLTPGIYIVSFLYDEYVIASSKIIIH